MPIVVASSGRANSVFKRMNFSKILSGSDPASKIFEEEVRLRNETSANIISSLRSKMIASDRKFQNVRVTV